MKEQMKPKKLQMKNNEGNKTCTIAMYAQRANEKLSQTKRNRVYECTESTARGNNTLYFYAGHRVSECREILGLYSHSAQQEAVKHVSVRCQLPQDEDEDSSDIAQSLSYHFYVKLAELTGLFQFSNCLVPANQLINILTMQNP